VASRKRRKFDCHLENYGELGRDINLAFCSGYNAPTEYAKPSLSCRERDTLKTY
jgi:hypothetical protein